MICRIGVVLLFAATLSADPRGDHFETHVRPLLVAHCLECHGAEGKKIKGGLRLTSRDELLRGGDSGPALVPGKPAESLLLSALLHKSEALKMPPQGRLSDAEIARVEQWIKDGGAWPASVSANRELPKGQLFTEEQRKFWAFQPVADPPTPDVKDRDWVRTSIDPFILAKLEAAGLKPSSPAGKHALLRRVTFDLTGLPPTPAEVAAFIGDQSPDAYGRVVDRLLASPAYGERWGRHWLDLARYADSNGLDENTAFGNAWRYRDYVLRSFDADKPYDRFLKEQIAGDLLPDASTNPDAITGTGFLALGPKLLAEPDKQKMKLDIADEQLDTVGRSILGLTLGCARCHDHKFDPIPTRDYYSLLGIFTSTRTMKNLATVAQAHERPLPATESAASKASRQALLTSHDAEVAAMTFAFRQQVLADARARVADYLVAAETGKARDPARPVLPEFVQGWARLVNADPRFAPWRAAARKPDAVAATLAAFTGDAPKGLLDKPLPESLPKLAERYAGLLKDDKLLVDPEGPFRLATPLPANPETHYPEETAKLSQATAARDAVLKQAPPTVMVLAVEEGAAYPQVKGDGRPRTLHVQVRGNYLTPGEEAPAVFPRIIAGDAPTPFLASTGAAPAPGKDEVRHGSARNASGRLELAEWITRPDHPLTARVLVNRVWKHHFGEGLVRTPDNFGLLGERPTHPDLLDHLAKRFVEEGWSIKRLHRLMVLSSTYRQSSGPPPAGDPENRLLSVMPRRRLEAEPLRDALLAVAGNLDPHRGGSLLNNGNFTYVTNTDTTATLRYDQPRRSVYLPVIRNNVYDWFAAFDFGDPHVPNGRRPETTVAPQALHLMNSPLVKRQAATFAASLAGDDAERIRSAYLRAYSRPATDAEVSRAVAYLTSFDTAEPSPDRAKAWASFCQALFAANEFAFVE